jgi:hypothetical protein
MSSKDSLARAERLLHELLEKQKKDKRMDAVRKAQSETDAKIALLPEMQRKNHKAES